MNQALLIILTVLVPALTGLLVLAIPNKIRWIKESFTLLATLAGLSLAAQLFNCDFAFALPWCGFGIEISFRIYQFSAFILLSLNAFAFLVAIFSSAFMQDHPSPNQFFGYLLLTLALASGAVLSNNLIFMLFFWEGLLVTLFGMIACGKKEAFPTAVKALIIVGVTDLFMLLGIALTGNLAGTYTMSQINLPLNGAANLAFLLLLIGTLAKSGAMPFHTWIPDAAVDAPLPFMALVPGAFEKLVGIYFLTRLSLNLFVLTPASWLTILLMVIGALTIILAVMMALVQKDYKRLLAYHAISQVGYMILGIGTAVPAGIVGGLFHMINNALYKSCLFLTGGAVEKQTGTTNLAKLGGLAGKMPVTFGCFFIAAAAISGVPPFNGFFSKELIYDGALERGFMYYLAAAAGSFFTAASFLKLGHAAYFDKPESTPKNVKEAGWPMLLPVIILAALCILFGVYNALPIKNLIQPILGEKIEGHNYAGMPSNLWLVLISLLTLGGAMLNHWFGVKKSGRGLGASEHIHHAPILSTLYDKAEKRWFDPYEIGLKFAGFCAKILWSVDRAVDWIYEVFTVKITLALSRGLKALHNGNVSVYVLWSLVGIAGLLIYILR